MTMNIGHFQFVEPERILSSALNGNYNLFLVSLSVLVAVMAAYTSFLLSERICKSEVRGQRVGWLIAGSLALGGGVWAMHFIGMLALNYSLAVHYDTKTTLISVLPALFASMVVLSCRDSQGRYKLKLISQSILMGGGIGVMHYLGMAAMHMEAEMRYAPGMFLLSIVVAVFLAFISLQMKQWAENGGIRAFSQKQGVLFASVVMGAAISGMHYTGMAAVYHFPVNVVLQDAPTWEPDVMALLIGLVMSGVLMLFVTAVFVSRQLELTRELKVSQVHLQTVFDSVNDGFITIDEKGVIDSFNPAAELLFGYTRDEVIGGNINSLLPEAYHPSLDDCFRHYIKAGEVSIIGSGGEVEGLRKDGTSFAMALAVTVAEIQGKLLFVAVVSDITERKYAEERLTKTNAELSMMAEVVQKTDSSVIITNTDRNIIWVNNGFTKISEYSLDDVVGRRPWEILHGADTNPDVAIEMRESLERDKRAEAEIVNYTKSGRAYWVHLETTPVFDDGNIIQYITVQHDITEHKRLMTELGQAKEEAEAANRAKSSFLAAMSHEIRTPMNGVVGMIDVLSQSQLDDGQRDVVATVKDSAFSLLGIIDDILDFSKIEAGRLGLERVPVSLESVVEGVGDTLLPMADKKDVEIILLCAPEIPRAVFSDPVRLRQILFNLGGNAIKFTGDDPERRGRVVLCAELMEAAGEEVTVRIRVMDNGIGMSPEVQARLFQPFVQGEDSTTRRFGGTGLGLTISRRLVDMMGGRIEMDSEAGEGSTFSVFLPLEVAPHETTQEIVDLADVSILVVTEEAKIGAFLGRYLACAGAQTVSTTNAAGVAAEISGLASASGEVLVVIESGGDAAAGRALRDQLREALSATASRFVILERGRRKVPRLDEDDSFLLDLNGMHRYAFLRAVAAVLGRVSIEPVTNAPEILEVKEALSVADAEAAGKLILVAEDNETNQKVLAHQLGILGYTAEVASDGREALDLWRSGRYALVLTDCHMPEMDGYELAQAIRDEEDDGHHIPIMAITADALKGTNERCLDSGMDDYLTKPVQLKPLGEKLAQWLPDSEINIATDTTAVVESTERVADVVDRAALIRVLGADDEEMLTTFYIDFVRLSQETVDGIMAAYQARSESEISAFGHRLKSSARAVGANALADCCTALEQAGKDADWTILDKEMEKFSDHFQAVSDWVQVNYA